MFKVNQQIRIKTGAELQADGHEPNALGSYHSVRYSFIKEMEKKLSGKQFKIKSVSGDGDLIRLHGDDDRFSISPDMIAEEMFKVGDKVRIMSFEKMEELYRKDSEGDLDVVVNEQNQAYFVQGMKELCGNEYTIVSIDEDGECSLTPPCHRWSITTGMLELVERKFAEEEVAVEEEIKVGDVVRMVTKDELNAFIEKHGTTPKFGWNGDMDNLCGKMFVITSIDDTDHVYGLDTRWSISTEMLVKLSAKELFKELEEVKSGATVIAPEIKSVADDKKLFSGIEEGTEYFFLDSDGDIDWYQSDEDSQDEEFYEQANCFTSYDAAEKIRDLQLLQREMLRFAEAHNAHICDWSDDEDKWELNRKNTGEWQVDSWNCYNNPFSVYFNSREVAEKALEEFGDRLTAIYE